MILVYTKAKFLDPQMPVDCQSPGLFETCPLPRKPATEAAHNPHQETKLGLRTLGLRNGRLVGQRIDQRDNRYGTTAWLDCVKIYQQT